MGQKVNPYGFRLGVTTDWKSRWFASRDKYVDYLTEDWKIRDYLMDKLPNAAISRVEVERTSGAALRPMSSVPTSPSSRATPSSSSTSTRSSSLSSTLR